MTVVLPNVRLLDAARERLIEEVRNSRAIIIVGETGSGKTTRTTHSPAE